VRKLLLKEDRNKYQKKNSFFLEKNSNLDGDEAFFLFHVLPFYEFYYHHTSLSTLSIVFVHTLHNQKKNQILHFF